MTHLSDSWAMASTSAVVVSTRRLEVRDCAASSLSLACSLCEGVHCVCIRIESHASHPSTPLPPHTSHNPSV